MLPSVRLTLYPVTGTHWLCVCPLEPHSTILISLPPDSTANIWTQLLVIPPSVPPTPPGTFSPGQHTEFLHLLLIRPSFQFLAQLLSSGGVSGLWRAPENTPMAKTTSAPWDAAHPVHSAMGLTPPYSHGSRLCGAALPNDGQKAAISLVWTFPRKAISLSPYLCSPDTLAVLGQNSPVSHIILYSNSHRQVTTSGWTLPSANQRAWKTSRMTHALVPLKLGNNLRMGSNLSWDI